MQDSRSNGLEAFRRTYFEECAELLESVYAHLSALEQGSADDETVHALFRAVHSIKGGGGAFGLERLVKFAHVFETLMDLLREGRLPLGPEILPLMLRAADTLADLVAGAQTGEGPPPGAEDELLQQLGHVANVEPAQPARRDVPATAGVPPATSVRDWIISFAPHRSLYASANEPLLIVRELARLGQLTAEPDLSGLPDLLDLDPTNSYLTWRFRLRSEATSATIGEAFEFVTDDCDLEIGEANTEPQIGAGDGGEVVADPPASNAEGEPRRTAGPATQSPEGGRQSRSIRIDVEKVDRLVNLVGELVINQAMLAQVGANLPTDLSPGLTSGLQTLSQNLRELQEGVMAIRAQPVRSVFSRMPRLVREVSSQIGKSARLIISGEATEIDKTVIEQLADPLTHLLRNALDHGIEPPDEREQSGKPAQGTILLSAEHRSGRIIIEVTDDGRGLNRDRILAKARERGLVSEDASLSSEEIDELIFLPGFSTATTVSSISGRGVGMDVVRRNVQALGGRISVSSAKGAGSRFTLSLPLTLAILDGMAVAVGAETYIIPLTNIMESLRPRPGALHPVVGRGDVLAIRGEYVPLVHLHRVFDVDGAESDPCSGLVVIVDGDNDRRFGIVVDEMLGQQQVVVKSLEANCGAIDGISGATILGNGGVALILDVARLQQIAGRPAPPWVEPAAAVIASIGQATTREARHA